MSLCTFYSACAFDICLLKHLLTYLLSSSPLRAFQRAQHEQGALSLGRPQGWLKNAKCPKFVPYRDKCYAYKDHTHTNTHTIMQVDDELSISVIVRLGHASVTFDPVTFDPVTFSMSRMSRGPANESLWSVSVK